MPVNDLAIRFTEEKYASKSEVMKELKTSLIDNIWNNIVNYRRSLFIKTTLKCMDSSDLLICKCTGIDNLISSLEEKLSHYLEECELFAQDKYLFDEFKINSEAEILKFVSSHQNNAKSKALLLSLINESVSPNGESDTFLINYLKTLEDLNNSHHIDENFLLDLYSSLINGYGSYRQVNDNNISNRVLVDRLYTSAKSVMIPTYISQLINFINNSSLDSFYKAYVSAYYIYLIKPFDKYNEEIAILLAKAILLEDGIDSLLLYVPLENLLDFSINDINKIMNDAQRNSDATYFLYHSYLKAGEAIDSINDYIAVYKGSIMRHEFYDEEVKEVEPVKISEEVETLVLPEEVVPHEEEVIIETVIKPVAEEPKKEKTPKKQVKKVEQYKPTYTGIAIDILTPELDEKEAAKLEGQLLELDPLLKKGEARFYARHCVLGRNYTIQQFKKCNRCAYETARTGMDHLVELGYYRKAAIKNKFIYSPIPRR